MTLFPMLPHSSPRLPSLLWASCIMLPQLSSSSSSSSFFLPYVLSIFSLILYLQVMPYHLPSFLSSLFINTNQNTLHKPLLPSLPHSPAALTITNTASFTHHHSHHSPTTSAAAATTPPSLGLAPPAEVTEPPTLPATT